MIRLLLIVLLAASMPATAQARKTAKVRVTEAFSVLPSQKLPRRDPYPYDGEDWKPAPRQTSRVWFKPPPRYIADRPAVYVNGKLMIYRECQVDRLQDPGENSCKPVFAWI